MKRTQSEILVMFLADQRGTWVPAHALQKLETPYGYVGSAGDVRARELARGECADQLKGKVERAEGRDIGLDPRFAYYRFKQAAPKQLQLV
jgi:hypothetical protein